MSLVEHLDLDESILLRTRHDYPRSTGGQFARGPRSYEWLLEDRIVRDWIDGYISEETREKKLYQLEKVILASRLDGPRELLQLTDRDVKTLVRRIVHWYLQRGKGVWARQVAITMKGFLEAHDRHLDFKRSEMVRTPALKKVAVEHIPTKTEVYRLAENSGSQRNRAIILCLFQSGVRVGCLCNWTFSLLGNQLDQELPRLVRIRVTPSFDTKLNLYGLSYYVTALREEAALTLRDYLNSRLETGWEPQPSDPLFVQEGIEPVKIKRAQVWRMVKSAARRAGLQPESVWVHCLRKSFRKVLNATPQIDEDTKEALMGHKLPGSRGSYFDYHDEDEVMAKYMQADFSRPTTFSKDSH